MFLPIPEGDQNRPKNGTREITQNKAWKLQFRLSRDCKLSKRLVVTGKRGPGQTPCTRLMSRKTTLRRYLGTYEGALEN